MDADLAYRAWLAIGQNHELDRFANTRVAFVAGFVSRATSPQDSVPSDRAAVDDPVAAVSAAARDVLAERRRQVESEGWTPEHDDEHAVGDLERAAVTYALYHLGVPGVAAVQGLEANYLWPWSWSWLKPKDRRSNLVKAGALLLAAIEKGDREYAKIIPRGFKTSGSADGDHAKGDGA